jgi:hypothetical protein
LGKPSAAPSRSNVAPVLPLHPVRPQDPALTGHPQGPPSTLVLQQLSCPGPIGVNRRWLPGQVPAPSRDLAQLPKNPRRHTQVEYGVALSTGLSFCRATVSTHCHHGLAPLAITARPTPTVGLPAARAYTAAAQPRCLHLLLAATRHGPSARCAIGGYHGGPHLLLHRLRGARRPASASGACGSQLSCRVTPQLIVIARCASPSAPWCVSLHAGQWASDVSCVTPTAPRGGWLVASSPSSCV